MLETDQQLRRQRKSTLPLMLGAVLVTGSAIGLLVWSQARSAADEPPVLTDEARAYLPSLDLQDVEMAANEDALGQTLLEITGRVENLGDRTVSLVEINCVFRDVNGVEIERQRAHIVRQRDGALVPSASQPFRMPFDAVPEGWNQALPSLFIAQIRFGE